MALTAEASPDGIAAAAHRVGGADAFLDEVVVEEADGDEALLQGGVGETRSRADADAAASSRMRSRHEVADVPGDVGAAGPAGVDAIADAYGQVVGQSPPVGLDGARCQAEVCLQLEPGARRGSGIEGGPPAALHRRHRQQHIPNLHRIHREGFPRTPSPETTTRE